MLPEFWNNRVLATDPPLDASQTQIPHNPDQTAFIQRWFEFHQGYRIVKHAHGAEEKVAVLGEPLRDVSPGLLPRTVQELRDEVANDASRAENRFGRDTTAEETAAEDTPQQSLEDALDSLLAEASDEEVEGSGATQAQAPAELEAIDMPPQRESTGLSRPLTRTEIHLQRARDRLVRVFGTREDQERDDYESPLSSMYNRAWDRYRQAEHNRETNTTAPASLETLTPRDRRDIEEQLMWGVMQESRRDTLAEHQVGNVRSYTPRNLSPARGPPFISGIVDPTSNTGANNATPSDSAPPDPSLTATASPPSLRTSLEQISTELSRLRIASEAVATARDALRNHRVPPILSLDDQPDRPPALTDAEMTKTMACQVCYSQIADIAVLPCGHMVMCMWCADVVCPVKHGNVPISVTKCPMCRKGVKSRVKIHTG